MTILNKRLVQFLSILTAGLLLALLGRIATGENAVTAEPEHYKVEFENDRVRIIRITYGPGERSGMHEHGDGVVVNVTPLRTRFTLPDGSTQEDESGAGVAVWSAAGMHAAENLTGRAIEAVYIELK